MIKTQLISDLLKALTALALVAAVLVVAVFEALQKGNFTLIQIAAGWAAAIVSAEFGFRSAISAVASGTGSASPKA